MKKNIFIIGFIMLSLWNWANAQKKIDFLFRFQYNYNLPVKGNPICLNEYKFTGVGDLYNLTFVRAPSVQIQMGIKFKRTIHLLGYSLLYSIFNSKLDAAYNLGPWGYINSSNPGYKSFELKINSHTKYSGLIYTIQYIIPAFKHEEIIFGLNLFYGRNKDAYYLKTYMQSYNQGASNNQFYYSESTEMQPYNKNICGLELSVGYNQNIWKGIQLSAFGGISYRFISIYYQFGLGINYKFSLPKKKKE